MRVIINLRFHLHFVPASEKEDVIREFWGPGASAGLAGPVSG